MRRPSLWRMVLSLIGAAVRLIAAHKQEAASPPRGCFLFFTNVRPKFRS